MTFWVGKEFLCHTVFCPYTLQGITPFCSGTDRWGGEVWGQHAVSPGLCVRHVRTGFHSVYDAPTQKLCGFQQHKRVFPSPYMVVRFCTPAADDRWGPACFPCLPILGPRLRAWPSLGRRPRRTKVGWKSWWLYRFRLMGSASGSLTCYWPSPKWVEQEGQSAQGRRWLITGKSITKTITIYRALSSVLKFKNFTNTCLSSKIYSNFTLHLVNPSSLKTQMFI